MPLPNENHVFKGYSPDDFLVLMERIESDGGQHLPGVCRGSKYKLEVPTHKGRRKEQFFTTGCLNESRFLVPYQAPEGDEALAAQGMAVVCAVDDAVGLWPRFQNTTPKED